MRGVGIYKTKQRSQDGFGHMGIIVGIVVVLVVGASGYYVWKKHNSGATDPLVSAALKSISCPATTDKDLCKFYASVKVSKYATITSVNTAGGKTNTSVYQSQGIDKFHVKLSGDTSYETITIGTTLYTKNSSDNTWWKQTIPLADVSKYDTKPAADTTYKAPETDSKTPQPTYKKLGTEKCGPNNKLTCLKYQIIDPSATDTTSYIWFDTTNYQLQRTQDITKDGTTDSTFAYGTVSITAPSPTKDLGPNQYLIPGQSEPATIPTATDSGDSAASAAAAQALQSLEQQYQSQQ